MTTALPTLTRAQSDALNWLRDHNSDGCLDKFGVVLAGGESAPVMRSTWNALRDAGLVEFYGSGRGRIRIVVPQ